MARKIIAGTLIAISSILLGLSIAGIALVWMYQEPLTQFSTTRLRAIDNELGQAQTALQNAERELERTLRAVESAEKSLETLKVDFVQAKALFGSVNGTLDKQLLPGLKASREKIDQAKSSLLELQGTLAKIKALPLADLNLPSDKLLGDLIASASLLDAQITRVENMVKKASTFLEDASYLMEADFSETKDNLQDFLTVVQEYDRKFTGWREQLAMLAESLPGWIKTAAISLTIFLLWFGLSQLSVIWNGLSLWRGGDAQVTLRPQVVDEAQKGGEQHSPAA
jgi:predicted  nucleic acid-binding Zn-ribbon protein